MDSLHCPPPTGGLVEDGCVSFPSQRARARVPALPVADVGVAIGASSLAESATLYRSALADMASAE